VDPHVSKLFSDTERRQAEEFLASGGKPISRGFDLTDAKIRAEILDRPAKEFTDFQIAPGCIPEPTAASIAILPDDWQEHREYNDPVEILNEHLEKFFEIPAHLYVSINDRKEVWVRGK
jgi:hypothetical protein